MGKSVRMLVASVAVVLGACTALPSQFTYGPAEPQALLVHGVDGNEYFIRAISWEARTVSNTEIALGNGTTIFSQYIGGYGVKRLPPGDYAITNSLSAANFSGYYTDTCFENMAPAFRVRAGSANVLPAFMGIISTEDYTLGPDLRRVQEIFSGFPGMTAPIAYAEFLGYIDISPRESADIVENSCGSGSTFEDLGPLPPVLQGRGGRKP